MTPSVLEANNGTWTGGGSSASWSDPANWGATPGAIGTLTNTGTATFNSSTGAGTPIVIDANRNLKSLFFTTGAGSFTIGSTAGNAIYLTTSATNAGIQIAAGATNAQTINAPLILASNASVAIENRSTTESATLTLNGGISATTGTSNLLIGGASHTGTNTVNGVISNGGGIVSLTKTSSAYWVLTGSNSYTGGTTISGGTLGISNKDALGTGLVNIGSTFGLKNASGSRLNVANALEFGGVANFNGDFTFSGPIALIGNGRSNLSIDDDVIMTGVISGTSATRGLTKTGAGTLTLSGSNTFAGGVTLNSGTLNINHSNALGSGTLYLTSTSAYVRNTSGKSVTIENVVDINPGLSRFDLENDLIINGKITTTNASTTARTLNVEGATLVINGSLTAGQGSSQYLKTGSGGLTLSGSNTYGTGFQFIDGTLNINNAYALSTGTFAIRLTGDKYLDNTSGSAITIATGNAIYIESGFTFKGSNDLDLGTGTVNISNYTITILDKTLTTGGLNGASGRTITKAGDGTWAISGSSTLPSSLITVQGGALRLSAANSLAGGIGTAGGTVRFVLNGGVAELTAASGNFNRALGTGYHQFQIGADGGGFSAYGADVVVNVGGASAAQTWGAGSWNDAAKLMFSSKTATHTVDFQNGINLKNTSGDVVREIYVENGSGKVDAKISGALTNTSGTAGINKTGAGTLELTGANTYNGLTTVSAGTLLVNGSISSALGVKVEEGATLGGRGTIAKVSGAGTLSAGNSAGIISVGEIDISEGMDFHFELTAATVDGVSVPLFSDAANSGNDVIRLTGANPFSGDFTLENTITIDLTGTTVTEGDIFLGGFFAISDFGNKIANAKFVFLGLGEGLSLNISTVTQNANFTDGTQSGYITQFEVVPEPSTTLFVLVGGAAGLGFLSRKRKAKKVA